jgi:ABC-2 type transport system ATP-binding protein
MVVAKQLGKSFGAKQVLDDLSFAVEPGDVIGVLGKNGAGKTTLLEVMLGFAPASRGSVTVFGDDSFKLSGAAKTRIGFVPQSEELIDHLTARDQLRMIASFYAKWDRVLIDELARKWEVDLNEKVRAMSVGQRQKLSILLSLGHRPDLLVLDEPVASLDPIARRQFLEQIVDIAADGSRAVVFSSHIVSDIERLANKIWILKEGRLYWSGDMDALKESVVRIHLRRSVPFAATFAIDGALTQQTQNGCLTAVVSEWSDARQRALTDQSGAAIEVERLALEEIFLELHR